MKQSVPTTAGSHHHEVFGRFPRWQGKVPEGFIVNFLGVLTRTSFWPEYKTISDTYPPDRFIATDYPVFDEEYFEWIDLLQAVTTAEGNFTMIELGAGFGRWTVNAAAALRHLGSLPDTLIAVEAEPTHFQWMIQHLTDNGLEPKDFRLIQAAVASADGKTGFHLGETPWGGPHIFYGQSVGGSHVVDAVSLTTLLRPFEKVDFIDLDVQGSELEVLAAGAEDLDEKVKRVHIGTHSPRIDEGLRSLFARLGWTCLYSFPCACSSRTEWGSISFADGVQAWLNPALVGNVRDDTEVLREKLSHSRAEGAKLWVELEKAQEEVARTKIERGSASWKIIERVRRIRDRLAPAGTRRRATLDMIIGKV